MSGKKSNPPRLAIWWLRHACPGSDNDALTGDLIERFREGQTRRWFWRQVLIACAVGVLGEIRRHWPHFCYAIAGAVLPAILWKSVKSLPRELHWWTLPWPFSQLVLDLSPWALLALTALPVLAAGLVISRTFRWVSLLRTALINLALITLGHLSLDFFPCLLRPAPDNPSHNFLIIPPVVQVLLFFSTFLVAAWLGCISPGHADEPERQAGNSRLIP
jgi:hypothetical protein